MNREIKFRGLRSDGNGWVYGYYSPVNVPILGTLGHCINENGYRAIDIEYSSLGQYTGLKDKNDKDIYEGDRIRYANSMEHGDGVIGFSAGFLIEWDLSTVKTEHPMIMQPLFYFQCSAEIEVIGNIHENPELLKGGDENG